MKKNITTFCLIASLLIILDTIGFWHMLLMFLVVGIIPGTNVTLAPIQMIILMLVLAGFVISRAFNLSLTRLYNSIISAKLASLRLQQLSNN